MSIMNEGQVRLLHKLQMAGVPAFKDVNPVTLSSDEASKLFKMNLPPVEWIDATGVTKDHEFIKKRFIGVSENNCREQMNNWLDRENLTLLQQPNPRFGYGENWFEYFMQPMNSVNTRALESHFKKWEISVPKFDGISGLEFAFDDCPEDRLEIYARHRKELDEKAFNKITPEQRAMIKALQASGKGPKIDRDVYLKFTGKDAAAYIKDHENNPKNTCEPVVYAQKTKSKTEAFPDIKKSNLIYFPPADYVQRSIIRDLANEGHIGTSKTKRELLDKLDFLTSSQADDLMEPHMDKPVGPGLLEQCKNYIEYGKIRNRPEIKTISDAHRLYHANCSKDFNMKSALRDLIEAGYIQSDDAMAKIAFTTREQDQVLIEKYGHAPIGDNLRARLYSLMDENSIGDMEEEQFKKLTVRESMAIISNRAEIDRFKNPKPATPAQKNLLKILIANRLSDPMPYSQWKSLTMADASGRIASVPEEKRKELFEKFAQKNPQKTVSLER